MLRGSRFSRRHDSDPHKEHLLAHQEENKPDVFEGTDDIGQNRKVAVSRVVEAHNALEKSEATATGRPASPAPSTRSCDSFYSNVSDSAILDSEIRTFRYFARMWNPSAASDPEFDEAVKSLPSKSKSEFEQAAIKHFFRRVAHWSDGDEVQKEVKARFGWDRKQRKTSSELEKLWKAEKGRQTHGLGDELKEITTREGLAQLFWTLMHDKDEPLAPELLLEYKKAVKRSYRIPC